jgi:hypothetical protein
LEDFSSAYSAAVLGALCVLRFFGVPGKDRSEIAEAAENSRRVCGETLKKAIDTPPVTKQSGTIKPSPFIIWNSYIR